MNNPAPWATIPELIDDSAARFATNEAMVDGDVRWNFAEFRDEIHRGARAFMATGIEAGDRIAIWAPNVWEWAIAALGAHCAGAVVVPVNTRFKGREANYLLANSGARMLFTVTDFLDTDYVAALREAGDVPASVEEVVVMRGECPDGTTAFADFVTRADGVDDADRAARSAAVTRDDLCHIMFTSGTTGDPKGAMLIHSAICRAYLAWASVIGLDEDRYLIVNPFFHSFGLNAGILACLMTGSTIIPHSVFDVPSVMNRIPEERISMLPGPPAIYQTILNHPDLAGLDMSSLRLAVTGAAPVPVPLVHAMGDTLGFETVITGYGLTEASGIATMCRHDDPPEVISGSSGRAIDDVKVLVVDADGDEVPRGEPGEVVVRGYNVMAGYLDDPDQTAEAVDADGWLHTGDIGVMDTDDYLDITDRLKDMFINGGFNVYPAEVEGQLLAHPDIAQVAVVGIPDERLGEVGMAFVVATSGTFPDPADLVAWARTEMANYKAPRCFEVVDALPVNASGKVLKYELRKRARSA